MTETIQNQQHRPIPWIGLSFDEVDQHRFRHCEFYEDCLNRMSAPRFIAGWSCIICEVAKGHLKEVCL